MSLAKTTSEMMDPIPADLMATLHTGLYQKKRKKKKKKEKK